MMLEKVLVELKSPKAEGLLYQVLLLECLILPVFKLLPGGMNQLQLLGCQMGFWVDIGRIVLRKIIGCC